MVRLFILTLFIAFGEVALGQNDGDNVILVHLTDTMKLYERVRQAITYTDLIIREDSRPDTLITKSERIHGKSIFVIAKVVIDGNTIKITGGYGLGLEDFWSYPAWPKSYKRIIYFKESEAWIIIRQIAIKLDGKMEFQKF